MKFVVSSPKTSRCLILYLLPHFHFPPLISFFFFFFFAQNFIVLLIYYVDFVSGESRRSGWWRSRRTTLISKTFRSARRSTTWRQCTGGGIRASTKDPSRSMKMKVGCAGNSRALFVFDLLSCLPKPSLAFYGAGREIFAAKKRLKQDIDLNIIDFRLDTRGNQPTPSPWRVGFSVREGVTTGLSEGGVFVGGVD